MGKYDKAIKSDNPAPQGQMFASVASIRAAIFDVIDHGDANGIPWMLRETERWGEEHGTLERSNFVDAVINRLAELQAPPHEGVKLENLCDRHKRSVLPAPTSKVCLGCEAERRVKHGS